MVDYKVLACLKQTDYE